MKTLSYYIIKTENEKFLQMEQTGNSDLDVYEVDELDAVGYETEEEANKEIDNIRNRIGHWNYFGDFSKPVKAVKLTISYEVEEN